MKYYAEKDYIKHDPVFPYALTKREAFTWDAMEKTSALSKIEKQVMNEAAEAGIKRGLAVPIHGPQGEVMGIGMASSIHNPPPNRDELRILNAIAHQFHLSATQFDDAPPHETVKLSKRQVEILQWAATGKSRSVIADILNISEYTVDHHFTETFKKLKCNDRITAILTAFHLGLIHI